MRGLSLLRVVAVILELAYNPGFMAGLVGPAGRGVGVAVGSAERHDPLTSQPQQDSVGVFCDCGEPEQLHVSPQEGKK